MPVFAAGVGAFLSIDRPTVAMGDAVFPVLTTRPTVGGPHADSTNVPDTTGGFDADLIAPERVQASFIKKRTDAARFAGLDSSLRMALNAGLEEKLDYEAIAGDEGLLTGTKLANHNSNATAKFADYLSRFAYARVDGRHAAQTTDVRAIVGVETYAHMGVSYRSDNADFTVLDSLAKKTGGVRVSAHVPVAVSNKQNAVVRLGSRRDMVQPVWSGVTIIVDEISLAGKGEIEITAVLLMNTKILRVAGILQAAKFAGLTWRSTSLAGPGCDATKLPYVASVRQPGDVVISVGSIYEALTAGRLDPIIEQCGLAPGVVLADDRDQAGA